MHRALLVTLFALVLVGLAGDSSARRTVGSVLFAGDFESGTYAPWSAQCSNTGYSNDASQDFGPIRIVKGAGGQGTYAAEFQLPADPNLKQRCQVIAKRTVNLGGDDYYSLMFSVPSGGFQPGTKAWGPQIAQLNFQNLNSGPTVALTAKSDHITVVLRTGKACSTSSPQIQYGSNADQPGQNLPPLYAVPPGQLVPGWHEFVIHTHNARDASGRIDVWHRLKGQQSWTQTVDFGGYPMVEWSCTGSIPPNTLDSIQAYRGPAQQPLTVLLDGFTRASSFAAAAAELP
jgi:polysaccharide lyase-like protein